MIESIDYVFKGLFGAVLAYFGYTGNKLVTSVSKAHEKADANDKALSAYKLEVIKDYARNDNITVSLARLHEQNEKRHDATDHKIEIIANDIKVLLSNNK